MANFGKQTSSKILAGQPLTWNQNGTIFSTNFGPQTYQVRVISQINGWLSFMQSTASSFSTTTYLSTAGGPTPAATFVAANTANGDYFTVSPGQIMQFTSTTTSSGILVSLSEMA